MLLVSRAGTILSAARNPSAPSNSGEHLSVGMPAAPYSKICLLDFRDHRKGCTFFDVTVILVASKEVEGCG
jgi:hypothetical protein